MGLILHSSNAAKRDGHPLMSNFSTAAGNSETAGFKDATIQFAMKRLTMTQPHDDY